MRRGANIALSPAAPDLSCPTSSPDPGPPQPKLAMPDPETKPDPQDATLIQRIAAQDAAALTLLIARHGPALRALATRYFGDRALAEDIVQDTFVRIWTRADRFDPARGPARPWIFRIATNLCTDHYRRRRLVSFFGLTADTPEPEADTPGIERQLSGQQDLALIRTHILALPARQRMALLLSVGADLNTDDIARSMVTSPGAVEQLLVRARRTLRADMATSPAGS